MQTLTYGHKLPEDGDKGSVWFPALEDNINQDDAHSHNGTDSAKISSASVTNLTQAIASGSWVAVGDGTGRFRQAVTLPGTVTFDTLIIRFRDASGNIYYLNTEKISANSFYVYINDNTLDLTAIYG